ncbi:hypothetical protein [Acidithiobacillus sp.]
MSITVTTKKLDGTNLQKLLRCDPSRIQAEEATPEAIETCRMMGVELLLSSAEGDYEGLKRASPEEAENILANTTTRIRLDINGHGDATHTADHVSVEDGVGSPYYMIFDDFAFYDFAFFPPSDENRGEPENIGGQATTTFHDNRVFSTLVKRLKSAGYIPGQTYEQCRNMALWHPGMAHVMESISNEGLFGLVTGCIAQSDLHHEVVPGKLRDGKKDASSSFVDDLHEVFSKHEALVAAGRAEGVQLAVSRKLLDLLGQHEGAEGYLGNLHII